jgi:7-cyano-7-deazaguanine reductase
MVRVLGEKVAAPKLYAPEVLEPIDRDGGRRGVDFGNLPALFGHDVWHLYELSWIEEGTGPVSRVGVLTIPASSPATVESKSLKLYLNSLNFHLFPSSAAAVLCITRDLAAVVGAAVQLTLLEPAEIGSITREPAGSVIHNAGAAAALGGDSVDRRGLLDTHDLRVEQQLMTHELRSLCPVTGQPDWATLWLHCEGRSLAPSSLAHYVESFREHQDFHEQCLERIFSDLWAVLEPSHLTVAAFYTRRGGIDITPWRSSNDLAPRQDRMGRQ